MTSMAAIGPRLGTWLLLVVIIGTLAQQNQWCRRGDSCWPTAAEIHSLQQDLSPSTERTLLWNGDGTARVGGVPIDSQNEQPLYGDGVNMAPVYVGATPTSASPCSPGEGEQYCHLAVRNSPYEAAEWDQLPAFIAWPTNAQEVSTCVIFARKHSLRICVTASGTDALNRHSCNGTGFNIRTSLLKDNPLFDSYEDCPAAYNLRWYGAGMTQEEVQYKVYREGNPKYVALGWDSTATLVGWLAGGGYGPMSNYAGLGGDNLEAVEIVLADGKIVNTECETRYRPLAAVLAGGAGLNYGVITKVAFKSSYMNSDQQKVGSDSKALPRYGLTECMISWSGDMCGQGLEQLFGLIDSQLEWSYELIRTWSGRVFITVDPTAGSCGKWTFFWNYVYNGPMTTQDFQETWAGRLSLSPPYDSQNATEYTSWWDRVKDEQRINKIIDHPVLQPSTNSPGGVPSVLVSREHVRNGTFSSVLRQRLSHPSSEPYRLMLFQSLTGNRYAPHQAGSLMTKAVRYSLYHFQERGASSELTSLYYTLGHQSYFGESAYIMDGWRQRYWDEYNYSIFLQAKNTLDPLNIFACHHCMGDPSN